MLKQFFVRVDDYPTGVRPKLPSYRLEAERVLGILEQHALPYILGVVPDHLEDEDYAFLAARRGMTVAMHGVSHSVDMHRRSIRTEFSKKSSSEIQAVLEQGRQRLSLPTSTFIPPANWYSDALLQALDGTGFKLCLATRPRVWSHRAKVTVLHAAPPMYGRSRGVLEALLGAKPSLLTGAHLRGRVYGSSIRMWERTRQAAHFRAHPPPTQIALHWTWERDDLEEGKSQLDALSSWLRNHQVLNGAELLALCSQNNNFN